MLKLLLQYVTLFIALILHGSLVIAQENSLSRLENPNFDSPGPSFAVNRYRPPLVPRSPERILSDFLDTEQRVREALNHHTFKRDVLLQTIGPNGKVTGEYIRNSQFVFDDRGNRIERVLFHPRSTIREMKITKEDIQDLAGAQLLGLDINEVNKYELRLAGRETMNDRDFYVINVIPKQMPNPHRMRERFLVGRLWIDATNLQILRVRGIVEPHGKQRFPVFDTFRESVTGRLFFPARTEADDILHFPNRDVHYRVQVRYYDYRRFASKVSITEVSGLPVN